MEITLKNHILDKLSDIFKNYQKDKTCQLDTFKNIIFQEIEQGLKQILPQKSLDKKTNKKESGKKTNKKSFDYSSKDLIYTSLKYTYVNDILKDIEDNFEYIIKNLIDDFNIQKLKTYIFEESMKKNVNLNVEAKPNIDGYCPRCGLQMVYQTISITRSLDEGATINNRCLNPKCNAVGFKPLSHPNCKSDEDLMD